MSRFKWKTYSVEITIPIPKTPEGRLRRMYENRLCEDRFERSVKAWEAMFIDKPLYHHGDKV